jgi:hypothetical protein
MSIGNHDFITWIEPITNSSNYTRPYVFCFVRNFPGIVFITALTIHPTFPNGVGLVSCQVPDTWPGPWYQVSYHLVPRTRHLVPHAAALGWVTKHRILRISIGNHDFITWICPITNPSNYTWPVCFCFVRDFPGIVFIKTLTIHPTFPNRVGLVSCQVPDTCQVPGTRWGTTCYHERGIWYHTLQLQVRWQNTGFFGCR